MDWGFRQYLPLRHYLAVIGCNSFVVLSGKCLVVLGAQWQMPRGLGVAALSSCE